MNRDEISDAPSTAGAQEMLASTSAAHLAYTAKDGTPRVMPVGFFWTGEQFVISTATTAPKVALRFYDFGAGRMPRFLQELAEQSRSPR